MSDEVSCVEMSLAATLISRENTAAKPNFFRQQTANQKNFRANIRLRSKNSASRLIYGG